MEDGELDVKVAFLGNPFEVYTYPLLHVNPDILAPEASEGKNITYHHGGGGKDVVIHLKNDLAGEGEPRYKDAHGKNYSLFLRSDGSVELCPLYDALCMRVWQETSDLLAMPINSKNRASELSLPDWAAEAAASGICEDDLVGAVEAIAAQIATHAPAVLAKYPDWIQETMTTAIAVNNQQPFQELGLRLER